MTHLAAAKCIAATGGMLAGFVACSSPVTPSPDIVPVTSGPYRLTLDGSASECPSPFQHAFAFDRDLIASGQSAVFVSPSLQYDFGPQFGDLKLELTVDGTRASGTLRGSSVTSNAPDQTFGHPLEVFVTSVDYVDYPPSGTHVNVSGSLGPGGTISGTFDGRLGVYIPYLDGSVCRATFKWSLSPR